VHLEALVLDTTDGTIDVRGGGGGGAACGGNPGECGGLDLLPSALVGGGGGTDCGGAGGDGAAAGALAGAPGAADYNGGGGGGGAGCVVLRRYGAGAPTVSTSPSVAGVLGVAAPMVR